MFLRKLANRFTKADKREVLLSRCVHYCGFPYGQKAFNPYEQYVHAVAAREDIRLRREAFIDFLRYYRPRNMDEALGIRSGAPAPLWVFPWCDIPPDVGKRLRGWVDDPDDAPDILTHFSEKGILEWRILEEFFWLERALYSIRRHGYQPEKHANFIHLLPLLRGDGEERYLVLDGNHRVCALSAVGETSCVAVLEKTVREQDVLRWPGVVRGFFSAEDAQVLLGGYFERSVVWRTTDVPCKVLF